jgi:hypothetical protein
MNKLKNTLISILLVVAVCFVFSLQFDRLTGDRQRRYEIGYIEGYDKGRLSMKTEFEDQMQVIKHARKMVKAGFEIGDKIKANK